MLFNTLKFLLVFPVIFGLYWYIPNRYNQWRKWFLILVSYLLYMNWKPTYALVLLVVTLITYGGGVFLSKFGNDCIRKRKLMWLFALMGMLPLLIFKYYNFINESITISLSTIGLQFCLPGLNWAVPVGISFFTFQAVGYLLDVYHGRTKAEKNFTDYVLFVSFFPQIASGPISKASELLPQIKRIHIFNYNQAVSGLRYFLWGLYLKVALADRTGIYVDSVFVSYDKFSGAGCVLASVLYSVQIYADFASYSLMAVGIAKTLGFDLINNFERPYFATSVSNFWRRWHISLTRWLTQQIYIPLGGSRCSKMLTYRNVLVTFLVSGMWHGANWTFIVWGGIHGLFLIVEKVFGWNKRESVGIVRVLRILFTFSIVTVAWVIFRSPSISDAFGFIGRYMTFNGMIISDVQTLLYIVIAITPLCLFEIGNEFFSKIYNNIWINTKVRWAVYLAVSAMIVLFGVLDGSSFIYVSF